jgi:hypothetical protein
VTTNSNGKRCSERAMKRVSNRTSWLAPWRSSMRAMAGRRSHEPRSCSATGRSRPKRPRGLAAEYGSATTFRWLLSSVTRSGQGHSGGRPRPASTVTRQRSRLSGRGKTPSRGGSSPRRPHRQPGRRGPAPPAATSADPLQSRTIWVARATNGSPDMRPPNLPTCSAKPRRRHSVSQLGQREGRRSVPMGHGTCPAPCRDGIDKRSSRPEKGSS